MTSVDLRGETLELLPERCLYRPLNKTLMAADLHWGKAEVFQRSGVAISSELLHDDLRRLSKALNRSRAERLVVLGDLIHAPSGITDEVAATVSAWRATHAELEVELVRGNHDRDFELPAEWRIRSYPLALHEAPFLLAHDPPPPEEADGLHVISGHIHPVIKLRGLGDSLRLPCFAIGKSHTVLPAFSLFTGGYELRARDWERLFVTTEHAVTEV